MNIAICDDDNNFCIQLKDKLLEELHIRCKEIYIIDTYNCGKQVLMDLSKKSYHVFFLDIDMPSLDGLSLADNLMKKNQNSIIVFVTSHDNFVFDAIKKHPYGFLRKSKISEELPSLLDDLILDFQSINKYYIIKRYNEIIRIPLAEIKYIESKGNNVLFYTDTEIYKKKIKLSTVESEIPDKLFVRISKSYIVNLGMIQGAITTKGIDLTDGLHLSVSRDRINIVKSKYFSYLRGNF